MKKVKTKYNDIDEYQAQFPASIRKTLQQLRETIKKAAPGVTEIISYGMPAFRQNKVLVYYAAYKAHIGFYPTSKPIIVLKEKLLKYKTSKGAIQFPLDKALPLALIRKIVKLRVADDLENAKVKNGKKGTETKSIATEIHTYHRKLSPSDRAICRLLAEVIHSGLPGAENKIWHGHPVWFLDGNPIAGYDRLKDCIRLLFWSGQSFDEPDLDKEGKFKAAEARYTSVDQINTRDLKRWVKKSIAIQWDYKNIVKRKGVLERLK